MLLLILIRLLWFQNTKNWILVIKTKQYNDKKTIQKVIFNKTILIIILLFADDSSLLFNSREDIIKESIIYINVIVKVRLTIHTNCRNKSSRTKVVFFLNSRTINH